MRSAPLGLEDVSASAGPEIGATEIRDALACALRSSAFAGSERLRQLLSYIVDSFLAHDAGGLKETAIGVAVFGRSPSYDPKIDSIVRTEIRRLREHLRDYYHSEGATAPLIIDLPKGAYVPQFTRPTPRAADAAFVPEPAAPREGRFSTRQLPLGGALGGVAITAVLLFLFLSADSPSPASATVSPRVVVLPFQGPAGQPESGTYGRAIASSAVAQLTQRQGLRVVPSWTSGWFDSPGLEERDEAEIARELGADYMVTGEFTKGQDQFTAWFRLTEMKGASVLMTRKFDFAWADLPRVEEQIGEALLSGVSQALEANTPALDSRPKSQEAHRAFLQGYYSFVNARQTFQIEALRTAERHLQRALELEPGYPDALATLSMAKLSPLYPWGPESARNLEDAEPLAKAALMRDPRHPVALAALSSVSLYRGQMQDALDYARQAGDIAPRDSEVLNQLAEVYEAMGLYESAAEVYRRCILTNPVTMNPYIFGALPLVRLGNYDEALSRARGFSSIDPGSIHMIGMEAYVLTRQGEFSAAEAKLTRTRAGLMDRFKDSPSLAFRYSYLDYALGLAQLRQGRPDFGREVVRRHGAVSRRHLDDVILLTAGLGMTQAAIENIETNPYYRNYRYLVSEPGLEPLYDEPGFRKLLEQTCSEWNRIIEDYGARLPVQPPTLLTPEQFIATRIVRSSS